MKDLISLFSLLCVLFSLASCGSDENRESKELVNQCLRNFEYFDKVNSLVEQASLSLRPADHVLAIKHGSSSGPFYMLTALILKGEEAYVLYADDALKEVVIKEFDYANAKRLVRGGSLIFFDDQKPSFLFDNVNSPPCYFVMSFDGLEKDQLAFVGRPESKRVLSYLRQIESIPLELEKSTSYELDNFLSLNESGLSENDVFYELSPLTEK